MSSWLVTNLGYISVFPTKLRVTVRRKDGINSTRLRFNADNRKGNNFTKVTIPNGETVEVLEIQPQWLRVQYSNISGWIQSKHVHLPAVTLNASWATQSDLKQGTEKRFVEYCQNKYGVQSKPLKDLPPCTKIWVEIIKKNKPAFLAIQEGIDNVSILNGYLPFYKIFTKSRTLTSGIKVTVHILVNELIAKDYTGSSHDIYKGTWEQFQKDRPIQIIWNTSGHYIINCHCPHSLTKSQIEKSIFNSLSFEQNLPNRPPIKRVTAFGDFNDHANPPRLSSRRQGEISIGLKSMVLRSKGWDKTCCFPNFKMGGDFVLDTDYAEGHKILGDKRNPYSDHLGVTALIPCNHIF